MNLTSWTIGESGDRRVLDDRPGSDGTSIFKLKGVGQLGREGGAGENQPKKIYLQNHTTTAKT